MNDNKFSLAPWTSTEPVKFHDAPAYCYIKDFDGNSIASVCSNHLEFDARLMASAPLMFQMLIQVAQDNTQAWIPHKAQVLVQAIRGEVDDE